MSNNFLIKSLIRFFDQIDQISNVKSLMNKIFWCVWFFRNRFGCWYNRQKSQTKLPSFVAWQLWIKLVIETTDWCYGNKTDSGLTSNKKLGSSFIFLNISATKTIKVKIKHNKLFNSSRDAFLKWASYQCSSGLTCNAANFLSK